MHFSAGPGLPSLQPDSGLHGTPLPDLLPFPLPGVQGLLRTKEVMDRLKAVPPGPGQKPPILVYLGVLLQKGKLNAIESAELGRYGAGGGGAGRAAGGRPPGPGISPGASGCCPRHSI